MKNENHAKIIEILNIAGRARKLGCYKVAHKLLLCVHVLRMNEVYKRTTILTN